MESHALKRITTQRLLTTHNSPDIDDMSASDLESGRRSDTPLSVPLCAKVVGAHAISSATPSPVNVSSERPTVLRSTEYIGWESVERRGWDLPFGLLEPGSETTTLGGLTGDVNDGRTPRTLKMVSKSLCKMSVLENGYYSDPPGVELYFKMGEDRNGLTLYRCRGTNSVEGNVHQNIIRKYDSFNTSPRHGVNVTLDYSVRHNITVGTRNRTGQPYISHFNISLNLAHLLDLTVKALKPSDINLCSRWVNGNDYEHANESFGIIKFKPDFFLPLGMFAYDEHCLPVHSREERDLFRLLVRSSPLFSDATNRQPNWTSLAVVWATHANGKTIFYKLPEHLKAYYKTWNDYCNENNTIAQNTAAAKRTRTLVRSSLPNITNIVAPTALPQTLRSTLSINATPVVDPETEELISWQIGNLLDSHAMQQSALLYLYVETAH
ncbi:hypothetical protein JVT61DRAFT_14979 [Boletus reticuloceps]|uniref:Uncharacterized protein n=1 Tax=Boletus reticuloceps TaxID=495285 RepID=A0A8I2YCH8_9AGAM|nr:hypothetical protein JVT61DRAFT_14979 [Boletus reticuloceps]